MNCTEECLDIIENCCKVEAQSTISATLANPSLIPVVSSMANSENLQLKNLPIWAVALITIASVAALVLLILALIALRNRSEESRSWSEIIKDLSIKQLAGSSGSRPNRESALSFRSSISARLSGSNRGLSRDSEIGDVDHPSIPRTLSIFSNGYIEELLKRKNTTATSSSSILSMDFVYKVKELLPANSDTLFLSAFESRPIVIHRGTTPIIQNSPLFEIVAAEIQQWYGLNHQNVVELLGADLADIPLIIYPYYEMNLEAYLKEKFIKSHQQKLSVVSGIAEGMLYLHQNSIYHGFLSPASVFIDEQGVAKAKLMDVSAHGTRIALGVDHTLPLLYSAPELRNNPLSNGDFQADVYAFGVVMFEVLSNNLIQSNELGMLEKGAMEQGLFDLISKALEPNPKNRPYFDEIVTTFLSVN